MKHNAMYVAILAAAIAILGAAALVADGHDGSDAAYSEDYGTVYGIDLAPGFSYSYTPSYPSDLAVTTTIEKYESAGISASMSGKTLSVSVKDGVTSGSYDIILKASSSTGGVSQTAYQHIRINVVSGLSVSGSINDIIKGASVSFTPSGSSGMGAVTWSVKSGTSLPAGLTLSGGKVTGTPTAVGTQTVSLTATAAGESKDLIVHFTVWSKIAGGSAQTITSHGDTVSSAAISNASDIGVTWKVTKGTLPAGFSLNASTGAISGKSAALQSVTVTITGTSSHGPAQTATKQITVRSEPALSLTGPSSLITYPGAPDKTAVFAATSGTSAVTWSVTSATGVSISAGTVTVTDGASAGSVTVTAKTAYGQTATKTLAITKEASAAISGDASLGTTVGTAATQTYTSNVGGTWAVSGAPAGTTVSISSAGVLSVSGSSPAIFNLTITHTTPGGQSVTKTVSCSIVSQLVFTSLPSSGVIAYEA
ncbi:putative Ig domain-containing protein [Methanomassiliicoccales archaeon LGM-DZ1]|nr:putative Ig domain-containing protein [Methanomassiliicoccales archaeon LGM-DZ1]